MRLFLIGALAGLLATPAFAAGHRHHPPHAHPRAAPAHPHAHHRRAAPAHLHIRRSQATHARKARHSVAAASGSIELQSATGADALARSLTAKSVMVYDVQAKKAVLAKNADRAAPIASISKLMTASVILASGADLGQKVTVTEADVDHLRNSSSRVPVGSVFTRGELLHLALIASDNRAAHALARTFPEGGEPAVVRRMNQTARELGLKHTRFIEPTGLSSSNQASAEDLAIMGDKLWRRYPQLQQITSQPHFEAAVTKVRDGREGQVHQVAFNNTNRIVRDGGWPIDLSKTGYIRESGYCLVMRTLVKGRPVMMVLLDASGSYARTRDAQRIRRWLESHSA